MSHPLATDLDHVLENTRDLWNEVRGQRIFITGATGFFGCWFLETFAWANQRLALGAKTTILTRNPRRLEDRIPHVASECDVVVGDVRTFAFPEGHFSHVIHGATESSATLCANEPEMMFDTIVSGTRQCLEFAAKAGARKFLLTSSGTVYGKQPADIESHSGRFYRRSGHAGPQFRLRLRGSVLRNFYARLQPETRRSK